jgi:hypothetical protein
MNTPSDPARKGVTKDWIALPKRILWVLFGVLLLIGGLEEPRRGYCLAEHFKGRKLGGILEGDWFFLFGIVFWLAAWALALLAFRRAFRRSIAARPDGRST